MSKGVEPSFSALQTGCLPTGCSELDLYASCHLLYVGETLAVLPVHLADFIVAVVAHKDSDTVPVD